MSVLGPGDRRSYEHRSQLLRTIGLGHGIPFQMGAVRSPTAVYVGLYFRVLGFNKLYLAPPD